MKSVLLIAFTLGAANVAAFGQNSAITYQGRLAANGSPYTGSAEMKFTLYDAETGGQAVAVSKPDIATVNVSDGLFTATLDFGAGAFPGAPRFLQIEVRTTLGSFFALTPRQALTPAPFALTAGVAITANGLKLPLSASVSSTEPAFKVANTGTGAAGAFLGKVGVGTAAPASLIHVLGNEPSIFLQDTASADRQAGYVSYRNITTGETAWVGFGTAGSPDFSVVNARPSGDIVFLPFTGSVVVPSASVGIGTATPLAELDVRGDIRLGPSGQFQATSGEENLRIIRGTVSSFGSVVSGTGYTVTHDDIGLYTISFTTPFADVAPTFTANSTHIVLIIGGAASRDHVQIRIVTLNTGGRIDESFSFSAIGRR